MITLAARAAQAQEVKVHPQNVLLIAREVLKPGRAAAHEKWEAGRPAAFAKANWPVHYWALSSMTGESLVPFMTGYQSMADLEKDNLAQQKNLSLAATEDTLKAKEGEFLSLSETALLTHLPDLSYRPEIPFKGLRYFLIEVVRTKPGHTDHFESIPKLMRAAHEKANVDKHYWVYQSTIGQPEGTYVVFIPLNSLADLDRARDSWGELRERAR